MKEQREKDSGVSLNEIYKLVKENNKMLKKMRRDAFVGGIIKFVWWAAILFIIPYLMYVFYLQPYVDQIQSLYGTVNESAQKVDQATSDFQNLKNSLPSWLGGES